MAIARALAVGSRVLIVDELSQGSQPSIVQSLTRALIEVTCDHRLGLILVDQNPQLAMQIRGKVMVMQRGEVVAEGVSAALADDKSFLDLLIVWALEVQAVGQANSVKRPSHRHSFHNSEATRMMTSMTPTTAR